MHEVLLRAALGLTLLGVATRIEPARTEARPNDNRVPAGQLAKGILTLHLEAREVLWYPEGKSSPGVPVYAFAERGKDPQIPGPLLRIPAGTEIHVSIHNSLPKMMRVRGLQDRQAAALDTFDISPGAEREIDFIATTPGTFFYWGRTEGDLDTPSDKTDAELAGAFVVDPPGSGATKDRVMVVSIWRDTLRTLANPGLREVPTINGLSWPHTERLDYHIGDTVRFRVINVSSAVHPMHLHGFYFKVSSRGDAIRDTIYTASQRRTAVTEFMRQMTTMSMSFVPTRPGNWLFHCHLVFHISRDLKLLYDESAPEHFANHALDGMAGLIMGIRVAGRGATTFPAEPAPRNRLRLFVDKRANVYGKEPGYAFVLQEGSSPPAPDSIRFPSSTIIVRKNEPTEIMVINRTPEPVTIHWHGIELQSYYDGVGGWSGWQQHTAPVVMAGDSFIVRMTPDRAGTFIYHTHTDENRQLTSGLYGPLIVLDANGGPNPNDRLMLMGGGGPGGGFRNPNELAPPFFNGKGTPDPIELTAGTQHRIRFVNITPAGIKRVRLVSGSTLQTWRAVAKDGADLPSTQANMRPADFLSGPGETMDFEITRKEPGDLTMEITTIVRGIVTSVVKIPVHVKAASG
ncbi:MAG: multicopper oxidase domain-containing protein [Gemmatimonadaceae bacterium]